MKLSMLYFVTTLITIFSFNYASAGERQHHKHKEKGDVVYCAFECGAIDTNNRKQTSRISIVNTDDKMLRSMLTVFDSNQHRVAQSYVSLGPHDMDDIDLCRTLDQRIKKVPRIGFVRISPFQDEKIAPGLVWIEKMDGRFPTEKPVGALKQSKSVKDEISNRAVISCKTVSVEVIRARSIARENNPPTIPLYFLHDSGPGATKDAEGGDGCHLDHITCGEGDGSPCIDDAANINGMGSAQGKTECHTNMAGELNCACSWTLKAN